MFPFLNDSKFVFLYKTVLVLVPTYLWLSAFWSWRKYHKSLRDKQTYYERHNRVVMYGEHHNQPATSGSPTRDAYESILYFIETAQRTLDVAMMIIDSATITNALIEVHKRGVRVRVLADFTYNKNTTSKDLKKAGVPIVYYVSTRHPGSILHYKYMVKDYPDVLGAVYMGSLNWTVSGIQHNYENTIFTMNPTTVKAFHDNFETAWEQINNINENKFVKAVMSGVAGYN